MIWSLVSTTAMTSMTCDWRIVRTYIAIQAQQIFSALSHVSKIHAVVYAFQNNVSIWIEKNMMYF